MAGWDDGLPSERGWDELNLFVARARQRLETVLWRTAGLGLPEFEALENTGRHAGKLRITDLARAIGLSEPGASRLVQRLVDQGLLIRCPCETDRRVTYAALTPRGEEVWHKAREAYLKTVRDVYGARLTGEEKACVADLFGRLLGYDVPQVPLA
jgi:DNA-binding MarR family transcriptional regulator